MQTCRGLQQQGRPLGARVASSPPAPVHTACRQSRRVLVARAEGPSGGGQGEPEQGRQPWDVMRFLKTVTYFNDLPTPEKILKQITTAVGLNPQAQEGQDAVVPLDLRVVPPANLDPIPVSVDGIIMVTGATGGVGKRVVARLLISGKHVRALVRDVEKAKAMLGSLQVAPGGRLELVTADIVQGQTLMPEAFEGVRAVVCCTAVKVQPKEGDTVDRQKYYQGIKFYDPEIVGDTPQTVEFVGMQNLLDAATEQLGTRDGAGLLDANGQSAARWGALDDVVMGGVSTSGIQLQQGAGENGGAAWVFSGTVSTDNMGGFASVRTRNLNPPLDLGPYAGMSIRFKGDGQRYKFIMRDSEDWDGIGYTTSFDTQPGVWQTVQLPFSAFFPVFRARRLTPDSPQAKPLDPTRISSIQIMLSKFEYDGKLNPAFRRGDFSLPISSISTFLPQDVAPRFVLVSSAGVTRPNRPGINVDMEPPAVKLNDALGGLLTWKLAGEDELRASGVPYAVVRPTALTDEPGGMPLEFDQGDVIKGKVSREDVADLCVALLSSPAATDTTFEVKSTVPFSQPWTIDPANPPEKRNWAELVEGLGLKRGVTGRTIQGVYTGKQTEQEALAAAGKTMLTSSQEEEEMEAVAA